jgi:hypothetical protein
MNAEPGALEFDSLTQALGSYGESISRVKMLMAVV